MNIIFNPASDADLQQIITDALAAEGDILVNDAVFVEIPKAKWEDKSTAKALKKDAKAAKKTAKKTTKKNEIVEDDESMDDLFIKVAEDNEKVVTKLGNSESWSKGGKKVLNGNYHPVGREELQAWVDELGVTALKVKNPIVSKAIDI